MKNIILLFVLTAFTILSCKKDEAVTPQNQLTIDGKTVAFPKAFRSGKASAGVESSDGPVSYGYTFWITESGVSYDVDKGKLSGTGRYFNVVLQSTSTNEGEIPVGTYSVDDETISIAELSTLTATGEDFIGDEPTKGSIIVSKSGSIYTIEIDLTMTGTGVDNSFPLKGHYTGEVTVVD